MARRPEQTWYRDAAELMVRNAVSLRQACLELEIDVTTDECEAILRSRGFQKTLWIVKQEYYAELANTPGRGKTAAIGMMLACIDMLMREGEHDKALEGLLKLGKLEGWVGGEAPPMVLNVTQKDIDEAKKRIEEIVNKRAADRAEPPADA